MATKSLRKNYRCLFITIIMIVLQSRGLVEIRLATSMMVSVAKVPDYRSGKLTEKTDTRAPSASPSGWFALTPHDCTTGCSVSVVTFGWPSFVLAWSTQADSENRTWWFTWDCKAWNAGLDTIRYGDWDGNAMNNPNDFCMTLKYRYERLINCSSRLLIEDFRLDIKMEKIIFFIFERYWFHASIISISLFILSLYTDK